MWLIRVAVITAALFSLAACESILLKPAADRYCSLPADERQAWRAVADTRTEPHEIRVYCHVNP